MRSFDFEEFVLPLFIGRSGDETTEPLHFVGTGFVIAPGLLVTCHHCVRSELGAGETYLAAVPDPADPRRARAVPLLNLAQDEGGADLALANIEAPVESPFVLSARNWPQGTDVAALGFPLTSFELRADGQRYLKTASRLLRGYVTREISPDRGYGERLSYELDMPAPAGLSGAPLCLPNSIIVVGVVYGSNDVGTIDQFERVDPKTGERTPEVQRVVSFGLALHTSSLRDVRGPATGGHPLSEVMAYYGRLEH